MATNEAAREIDRIQRELDAKGQPHAQPTKSNSGKGRNGHEGGVGDPPLSITISMQSLLVLFC